MARHTLPPYVRRPTEDAAAKIARLLAELAAAKQQAPEPVVRWWLQW